MGKKNLEKNIYDCIVIGCGASGLFYSAAESMKNGTSGKKLLLEKTAHPGQKLLMSGNGMCNITHGGSIKDFVYHYGDNGRLIRVCLYRHNNLELCGMMDALGVPVEEREDGKIFPASMKASDVLDALLSTVEKGGWELKCNASVSGIRTSASSENITVFLTDGTELSTKKLIIATGGASYPSTGSDGSFKAIIERDLGIKTVPLSPALTPVYVQNFRYGELSGISFDDVKLSCCGNSTRGPMLITHKGFSGPAVLHISQYVKPGDTLTINYIPAIDDPLHKLKSEQAGNNAGIANHLASSLCVPKSFTSMLIRELGFDDGPEKKTSSLTGKELADISVSLTAHTYSVSGTGGWNDAMVTKGGVSLDQIDTRTMKVKALSDTCDIRIIGEALDINGDTGGYNLQFAYSSAKAALQHDQ